ncbi:hypothetical protein ABT124_36430 [Streptomyces sp. NPDC001982]|uniref:hypothetical protein n=1 Tax=Streptomyces sp. NPDC001982 TaxID=3154405 RepID=UPI00333089B4
MRSPGPVPCATRTASGRPSWYTRTDRILGVALLGPESGETLAAVQIAMLVDLPYTSLRDMILTHPTMSEGLNLLFAALQR